MIPTWIQLTAGQPWPGVLSLTLVCTVLMWTVWRWGKFGGRVQAVLGLIFCIFALGGWIRQASYIWPGGNQYPAVPLVIMALAGWSAAKGPKASAAVGCVIFWVVLLVYLVTISTGVLAVEGQWLYWEGFKWDTSSFALSLLPCAAAMWKGRGGVPKRLLVIPALTICAGVVTVGVLSPTLADVQVNSFLELSKCLTIFGRVRRFEAVVSAGMTLGWFCLATMLLNMCGELSVKLKFGIEKPFVFGSVLLSSVVMLWNLHISWVILGILGAVCWVLIPLLPQGIESEKKS